MTTDLPTAPAAEPFDVFLSHNSREKPTVERIAERLKRDAVEPWLDKWCLTSGGDWQEELAEGLRRSKACAVFIGPAGVGNWARLELKLATDRMAKDRDFRVFLVLLPGLPDPFDTSTLPPFLTTRTWVDLRRGIADPRAFQTLINAVHGLASGPETPIAARDDVCPYRGLRPFDEEHAEFFYGRDADIQRLVEKLKTSRFLAVLGPSGSGKSSVVRAGLIPALRRGALPGSEAWQVQVFTPGASPLTQLAANLVRFYPAVSAVKTLDELTADERALHLACSVALAERAEAERVVWVVDQFEEVFTLCRDEAERARFISNLLYAAGAPGGRALVVLTMRADFYQKCATYPELSAQVAAQQFLVSPLGAEGLRQAIAEPAWRVGLEFEPGLVETVLEDVEGQPGALPLLEHALLELWERRRGRLLTLEAYRETGGVEGAIAKRADAVFETFDAGRQEIARRVMLRLTQPGEGTEDTRRRATMAELVTRPAEAEQVQEVVRALADARLLTAGVVEEGGAEVVDVSHEALIRSWPRLRRWIEEDRQGLRTHRRVTEAALEWQRANRDESLLFRGARLAQTLEWRERNRAAVNDLERDFLDAGAGAEERARRAAQRRTRHIFVGLVVALVLISAASVYAFVQSRLAARRGEEAFTRELAANAMAQLPINPELSLRLAIEAAGRAHLPETETTLRQVLARAPLHVLRSGAKSVSSLYFPTGNFSRQGGLVAYSYGDGLRAFDAASGQVVFERKLERPIQYSLMSPGGDLIAVSFNAGEGGEGPSGVQLWDVRAGRLASTLPASEAPFTMAFSPDGKLLAAPNSEKTQLFEVATGRLVAEVEGDSPAFSGDGRLLLTKGNNLEDYKLFVTDTAGWRRVGEVPSMWTRWEGVPVGALSPDGRYVVAAQEGGGVRLHEARGGRLVREVKGEWSTAPSHAAFSPDGRLVAVAAYGKPVVWEPGAAEEATQELSEVFSPIAGLSFSPDGRMLVAVAGTARVFDVGSSRLVAEYSAAGGAFITTAAFSPDGRYLLTTNNDATACVWDLNTARAQTVTPASAPTPEVELFDANPGGAALSSDGKLAARVKPAGEGPSGAYVWEVGAGRPTRLFGHADEVTTVAFSPDGTRLLTTDADSAQVWDVGAGRVVAELRHGEGLSGAAYSPDAKLIVTSGTKMAKVWGAGDGRPVAEVAAAGEVTSAAFSPDGGRLLLTEGGQLRVWDIGAGRAALEIGERQEEGGLARAVYSPDGRHILTWERVEAGSRRNSLQVRDAATGRVVVELHGHVDEIRSVAFSPGGAYLLTTSGYNPMAGGGQDPPDELNSVRVWELRSGAAFYDFRDHPGQVTAGAFAADGKTVFGFAQSGAVHAYPCELCVPQEGLLRLAAARSVRPLTADERARYLREAPND